MISAIRITCPLHARAIFHVLSHIDAGRDAANLFRGPTHPPLLWQPALQTAWQQAPAEARLALHGLAHRYDHLDRLLPDLEAHRFNWARTPEGQALADAFLITLLLVLPDLEPAHTADAAAIQRAQRCHDALASPLQACRDGLWQRLNQPAPPLTIMDCPPLGPHGRGGQLPDGHRAVITSLAEPLDHLFCQVLHEEIHAVTDRQVLTEMQGITHDTRQGSRGHQLHRALEQAALITGDHLIRDHAPAWRPAYTAWLTRWGVTL